MQYLKENVKDGVDFSLLIIIKRFFKVILPFLMRVARHVQITRNRKFDISLQYLKREENDEVDFLHAGKSMKTYYKLILWFLLRWSSISKVPKIASLQKKIEMKLIFGLQISIKVAYQLISTLWAPKLATRSYYDYW